MATKAIILASGMGIRLGPKRKKIHKALIKIGDQTLIERTLDALMANDIDDIVITTGYREEKIKKHIAEKKKYRQLNIECVRNPEYRQTNYIYSLWLARDKLKAVDIVMVHADMVYDYSLFNNIVKKKQSHVIVVKNKLPVEKDLKAVVENGKVTYIGLTPSGNNSYLTFSLLKLTKKDMKIWMDEVDNFVTQGITDCYAENAFNNVSHKINLRPLFYDTELGMDIDNQDDLKKVRAHFKNQ